MVSRTIYILHKSGAKSHYTGLEHLLKTNNSIIKYREFSVFSIFFKAVKSDDLGLIKKQFFNFFFLINLLFTKNKKIVLGIAPFDNKLALLLFHLKHHKVYYHTSWACWDKTFYPKTKDVNKKTFAQWQHFLEQKVEHIFTVTPKSKTELLNNYNIAEHRISVVYHALNPKFSEVLETQKKRNSFIYLGRLIPEKGINELLEFFASHSKASLTIIGKGKLETEVAHFANTYKNINFINHTKNIDAIIQHISKHEYVVLNSKQTKKWEELFGLIIIECMSQGLIPIAPTHSGPTTIIKKDFGYLFQEGEIHKTLSNIIDFPVFNKQMSRNAIAASTQYSTIKTAPFWASILN